MAQPGKPKPAALSPPPHLALDSLLLMEFRRDKVRGRNEALSSGAGSSLSSPPLGLLGPSWGGKNGYGCTDVHHHHHAQPRASGSRALFLLTWVGGVSLPVLGAAGLAVVARRRSGVVLGRTGASSDRELGRAGTAQQGKLHPTAPAFRTTPGQPPCA